MVTINSSLSKLRFIRPYGIGVSDEVAADFILELERELYNETVSRRIGGEERIAEQYPEDGDFLLIVQGALGDCYYWHVLAEAALMGDGEDKKMYETYAAKSAKLLQKWKSKFVQTHKLYGEQ